MNESFGDGALGWAGLYLDGRVGRRLPNGMVIPTRMPKVYIVATADTVCDCGFSMGFTGRGEGGKSKDVHKKKRWLFECRSCGATRFIPKPRRLR